MRVNDLRPLAIATSSHEREDRDAETPWVDVVRGAVRPEFAVAIYIPEEGDAALFPRSCLVAECSGPAHSKLLCNRHRRMWREAGRPSVRDWASSDFARGITSLERSRVIRPCPVDGCRRSAAAITCRRHDAVARAHFNGNFNLMIDTLVNDDEFAGRETQSCYAPWCAFPISPRSVASKDEGKRLCDAHYEKFSRARAHLARTGRPTASVDEWLGTLRETYHPKFRTYGLPETLLWEVRFALQTRHDQQTKQWRTDQHSQFVNRLRQTGLTTLMIEGEALDDAMRRVGANSLSLGFARFARACLVLLRDRDSNDIYVRDKWDLVALGFDSAARGDQRHLLFEGIDPPWLRDAVKEWIKHRLDTKEIATVAGNLKTIRTMCRLLGKANALPARPQDFTRATIERYIRAQRQANYANNYRRSQMASLNLFLLFCQRTGCIPGLPSQTILYPEDIPKMVRPMPRYISEHVMAQIETVEALDSIRSFEARTLLRVMIECGLRGKCARHLGIDALQRDPQGVPYLRYTNTKFNREAVVPISEALAEVLIEQRARTLARWPHTPYLLPRQTANPDGSIAYSNGAWKQQFKDWKEAVALVDEAGQPVNVTGHQFRHTAGTRMVNSGVPVEAVRAFLDHSSVQMTEVYARVTPTTVRAAAKPYLDYLDQVFRAGPDAVSKPSTLKTDDDTDQTYPGTRQHLRGVLNALFGSPTVATGHPNEDEANS